MGAARLNLLVLMRRTAWPLLDLDHELLVAASLGVAAAVCSSNAVGLELLDQHILLDGQAPVISRGVDQDLLAVVLVLFGGVPLGLLLS